MKKVTEKTKNVEKIIPPVRTDAASKKAISSVPYFFRYRMM
jgi:hypothetical protein